MKRPETFEEAFIWFGKAARAYSISYDGLLQETFMQAYADGYITEPIRVDASSFEAVQKALLTLCHCLYDSLEETHPHLLSHSLLWNSRGKPSNITITPEQREDSAVQDSFDKYH